MRGGGGSYGGTGKPGGNFRIEFGEVRAWRKNGTGSTGLLAYSDTQIDANTGFGVLRIRGERLTLVAMTGEELRIGGKINGVEWVPC